MARKNYKGHVKDLRLRKQGYQGDYPFWARTYTPDGREYSVCFADKDQAEVWLSEQTVEMAQGDWVDPFLGRVTYRDYAEEWRQARMHATNTAIQVESHFRLHVYPAIGQCLLADVTSADIQRMIKDLSMTLAPSTVEVIYNHVAASFNRAVKTQQLRRSPCVDIVLPRKEGNIQVEPLMYEEIEAVADAMPERWRAAVWLCAGTGMRQGEALGFTVDRWHRKRGAAKIDRQMVTPSGLTDAQKAEVAALKQKRLKPVWGYYTRPHFAPLKTKASYRTVPLPDSVAAVLAEHIAKFPPPTSGEMEGLLFTTQKGQPVRRQRMADAWAAAARSVGVLESFHATRHFYASLLIEAGESVVVVQRRLGHASATETLDTYAHLWRDSEIKTRDAVDGVFRRHLEVDEDEGPDAISA